MNYPIIRFGDRCLDTYIITLSDHPFNSLPTGWEKTACPWLGPTVLAIVVQAGSFVVLLVASSALVRRWWDRLRHRPALADRRD